MGARKRLPWGSGRPPRQALVSPWASLPHGARGGRKRAGSSRRCSRQRPALPFSGTCRESGARRESRAVTRRGTGRLAGAGGRVAPWECQRAAACAASRQLRWLGVCVQCSDVDGLCKSPATLLLLSRCLCDNDSLQLHLLGHPGQASLWRDVDASVVDRPCHDALWPCAAAYSCAPAGASPSREEGGVMAAEGTQHHTAPWPSPACPMTVSPVPS
ncbi:uncharacterized protein LOC114013516 [Falco peregrinus]|uniref:uncharacterized protein LOC114013516 n=1 Tax=Falco peregrinus TaxID=8954 RepID=UPI00247B06E2|nr:uncharacterized protein LOC114013516 [Falco peregrinus]